jgi:hypothetical protein
LLMDDGSFPAYVRLICTLCSALRGKLRPGSSSLCNRAGLKLERRIVRVEFVGLHRIEYGRSELRGEDVASRAFVFEPYSIDVMAGDNLDGRNMRLTRWGQQPQLRGAGYGGLQLQVLVAVPSAENIPAIKQLFHDDCPITPLFIAVWNRSARRAELWFADDGLAFELELSAWVCIAQWAEATLSLDRTG